MERGQGDYWVAFTTRPLRENLAQLWLTSIGVESAVPMAIRPGRKTSRHVKAPPPPTKTPAIRGYVFALVPQHQPFADFAYRVSICPSIRHPVGVGGKPIRLKPNWAETLNPEALDPHCIAPSPVAVGDIVAITEEWQAFGGFTGRVESIRGHEVTLLLDGLRTALLKLPVNGIRRLAA